MRIGSLRGVGNVVVDRGRTSGAGVRPKSETPRFSTSSDVRETSRQRLSPRETQVHRRGRNGSAVERTIAYLRRSDRIVPGDEATLALARTTAAALDKAEGSYDVAVLARVHLAAVSTLLSGHAPADADNLDAILAAIRGA
jgi:hypothetical protein